MTTGATVGDHSTGANGLGTAAAGVRLGALVHHEKALRALVPGYEPFNLPGAPWPPEEPPAAPRPTFLAHLPLEFGRADHGRETLARMLIWATGSFLYQDDDDPLVWTAGWQATLDTFLDAGVVPDLTVSPKNIDDLAGFTDWCRHWPAEIAQRMRVKFWQEPEDNFTTAEARAAFRAKVQTAAAIVRPFGIQNGVHLQGYALSDYPDYPHGPDIVAEFIEPAFVDHVGWSMFEWNGHDSGPTQCKRVADFMAARFPSIPWSFDAIGFSVPIGAGDDSRNRRSVNASSAFAAVMKTPATGISWYDVINRDLSKMRDFLVDAQLQPVLATAAAALAAGKRGEWWGGEPQQ